MGCAAIAIGVFLSSLTENQIIAAVSGVAALLLAYMMPSLRTMFTTGSAVALALFTAIAAALSVVAGLRAKASHWAAFPLRGAAWRLRRCSCSRVAG